MTRVDVGFLSDVGRMRVHNEDAYCALVHEEAKPGIDALLAVADGMGGHQAGEVASWRAIETVRRVFARDDENNHTEETPGPATYAAMVREAIREANRDVHMLSGSRSEMLGMGTTIVVALIAGPCAYVGNVGDSRAYLVREGTIRQLSQDHSWVAEQVRMGLINCGQARVHPRKNILTKCLGTSADVDVDTCELTVVRGDSLVLCSDGLHNMLSEREILKEVHRYEPQRACVSLVDTANSRGGHDNITVVIASLREG